MNEILLYGPIWSQSTRQFMLDMQMIDTESLTIRINTDGGSVEDGWSIVTRIAEFEGKKLVKVDGRAYSMGCWALLYADETEAVDQIVSDQDEITITQADTYVPGEHADESATITITPSESATDREMSTDPYLWQPDASDSRWNLAQWNDLVISEK